MSKMTQEKLAELARQSKELANIDVEMLDIDNLSSDEIANLAILSRLYRLADSRYHEILTEHLENFHTLVGADRMVDILTMEYLLELPLSYKSISEFMVSMKAAAVKHGIAVPEFWDEVINGQFDYDAEIIGE